MDRKEFLKRVGIAGLGMTLPGVGVLAKPKETGAEGSAECVLIPSETAGPFPLDLTENATFFRQDVRESKEGVQLNLRLRIVGEDNCQPMPNVRVNIWHCDKDGLYSGYSQQNNQGQAGLTYLRGYQFTDANGDVEFVTIFPGWYTGRICHIHFQVHVSSSYSAVSQLTFDLSAKNALYGANPSIYTKGADPLNYTQDNIFSDGYQYQLATLTENEATGGYDSFLEVTVRGQGTLGVGHAEKEASKQMSLGQNSPNPFGDRTSIPYSLTQTSEVLLSLWNTNGERVATLPQGTIGPGTHRIEIDMESLGIGSANYAYQLEVRNGDGRFTDTRMMTGAR